MRFADYAKLYLKAGDGGDGAVSFRREKFVPKGGPDGGDGGRGGHIVLRGNAQMNTLLDLRYKKYIKARAGQRGGSSNKTGKDAESIILEVPPGTEAYEFGTRRRLGEIVKNGEQLILARGGRGGSGNARFKTATNQAPRKALPGEQGQEIVVEIELKLIADVGLVGFPNAGKSTLLSVLSAAKPKIADYPFTTLEPNLGVVTLPDHRSFVMADIPGIIEDAHEGRGLGLRFLRHIERNRLLLFVISCENDVESEYKILCEELRRYRRDLLDKPRLVAVTKADLSPAENDHDINIDTSYIFVSATTGYNLDELREQVWSRLISAEQQDESFPE